MQKNDLFELEITDMGADGEGIGHYDGMTFFVKDALIGDQIVARATKMKKNYGYARVEEIKRPSTFRIMPKCELHRRCGGCQIQALSYEKQLEFKAQKVRNNLIRIGGFSEEEIDAKMLPAIGMEQPYRYRNKAQFPIGTDKEGNIVAGFYASRTHSIIPVEDCYLGVEENQKILSAVKGWMKECNIKAYDEVSGTGLVRHVLIRYGFTTKEIMVCLVINGKALPRADVLIQKLEKMQGMTSISYNVNMEKTNVILGKRTECIWGQAYITDYIHLRKCPDFSAENYEEYHVIVDEETERKEWNYEVMDTAIAYQISPQSFYQVNPVQTEKLYSTALEFAGLTGNESVWDLYCGIGTISLFLSQKAKQVYGVEIVPQAIEDAKNNAALNGIENVEFLVGKAEEVLPEFYENVSKEAGNGDGARSEMLRPDVIVVDPPRKGCDSKCLDIMLQMAPEKIVYVSCDSATLARDLKILCEGGYEVRKVQVFDQFAHSVHVETVVKLSLKKDTPKIEVTMEPDGESNYTPEEKVTYQKIKDYVKDKYGVKVSSLYIAQVKRMCGLDLGENYNKSKKENPVVVQCPQEKVEYIKDALRYFGLLQKRVK